MAMHGQGVALPVRGSIIRMVLVWMKQEVLLLLREPVAIFFSLAFPLVIYFFIGAPYADQEVKPGIKFIDMMFPTLIGTVGANLLLMGMPVYFAELRARGVDRRYRSIPLPGMVFALSIVGAMLLLVAMASALIVVVVGVAHGVRNEIFTPEFISMNLLLLAWLCALGYFLGSLNVGSRTTQAISAALFFLMFFGSGAAAPLEGLPSWLQTVTEFNPLRHWFDLLTGVYTSADVSTESFVKAFLVLPVAAATGFLGLYLNKRSSN